MKFTINDRAKSITIVIGKFIDISYSDYWINKEFITF